MISSHIVIVWREGLHLRAAASLVRLASRFRCCVRLRADERVADAVNIMQLMLLSACQGTELIVEADGQDEVDAVRAVTGFFGNAELCDVPASAPDDEMAPEPSSAALNASPTARNQNTVTRP